jgi:UDP-glucose 4-epimerase
MKILIPGIAGGVGRKLALRLNERGHSVVGIDVRPWTDAPKPIEVHRVDIRKRAAEDVFRKARPEVVVHMATVTSLVVRGEERYRINLGGTQAVFENCARYGTKQVVFVGRHTYYGVGSDAPLFHTENEPPSGLGDHPELADLVAADLYASTALWRMPAIRTAVLRICYTLGPSGHGTLATFLRGKRVPAVLGFDPLFQFMHEDDVVTAITMAIEQKLHGVYNVAGPQPVPFSVVIRATGRQRIPIPEALLALALGKGGLPKLPRGALGHIKYPVVVDSSAFTQATGFEHELDEGQTLRDFRAAFPPPSRDAH